MSQLRDGNLAAAVRWYAEHDRIAVSADRDTLINQIADAWLAEALSHPDLGSDLGSHVGSRVGMYAWQRHNVEALNQAARARWEAAHRLAGPELEAPGGRRYRAGDRIVTLALGGDGQIVTSERGTVVSVDPATGELVARMDDRRHQTFTREQTAWDRLAHGYAVTVHRSQGATVDVAHHLADGGGRELAYVAMSRARERTTVHVVADDLAQAVEDLNREWSRETRPRWAIDTGIPARVPESVPARPTADTNRAEAVREAKLRAGCSAIRAVIPPGAERSLQREQERLGALRDERDRILEHRPSNDYPDLRAAAHELRQAEEDLRHARKVPEPPARGWRQRRRPVPPVDTSRQDRLDEARRHYDDAARPHLDKLDSQITDTDTRLAGLRQARQQRATWERDHPDAGRRLTRLYEELQLLEGSRYRERRREHGRPSGNDILYRSRGIERDDPGRGLSR